MGTPQDIEKINQPDTHTQIAQITSKLGTNVIQHLP
jgi:hypothetical protein